MTDHALKLMVTGGSGFLGGYVLREAARRGHQTVALARSETAAAAVTALGARPVTGDLDDPRSVANAFARSGCDVLVNLASLGFGHGPGIVAAAELAGIPRAVFVSTTAVTTTLAARSRQVRLAAEQQVRESALDWTILRPTMIYGDAERPEPVPAAAAAAPHAGAAGAGTAATCSSRCTSPTSPTRCWPPRNARPRPGTPTTWPGPSRSRSPSCSGSRPAPWPAGRASSRCRCFP